jgi:AmpD protein
MPQKSQILGNQLAVIQFQHSLTCAPIVRLAGHGRKRGLYREVSRRDNGTQCVFEGDLRLQVDPNTGLISPARQLESPNKDQRPDGCVPELVVLHGISLPPGQFGGSWIDDLFLNRLDRNAHPFFENIADARVSSHLLISRSGELTQYVPFGDRAWHAGESEYFGRRACNDFSVGIELEGTDDMPYTGEQYDTLTRVLIALTTAYPTLDPLRIVGHRDIAPGRKTDPGPSFDWLRCDRCVAVARARRRLAALAV